MQDSAALWHIAALDDLALYRATIVHHSFKSHSHDTYVIGLVDDGIQRFTCERTRFTTQPRGVIVIPPGEMHTGEAGIPTGFSYRALYPTAAMVERAAADLRDDQPGATIGVNFSQRVIDDPGLFAAWHTLHRDLESPFPPTLEIQSRFRMLTALMVARHAGRSPVKLSPPRRARADMIRVRAFIDAQYAAPILLDELARLAHCTPFTLIRVFRAQFGMTPHAYLEHVRIRQSQQMIRSQLPLSEVAYAVGFSSQSHFTTSFRRMIGVTPGVYAQAMRV